MHRVARNLLRAGPLMATALSALFALALPAAAAPPATQYEIIGYHLGRAAGNSTSSPASSIDATQLTVINYAFLDICWNGQHGNPSPEADGKTLPCKDGDGAAINPPNGSIVLGDPAADSTNGGSGANTLGALLALKSANPKLKLLASVGGWNWSNQFSNMAAGADTRSNFIRSALAFVRQYKFDGIDIDWEYPTSIGLPCAPGATCQRASDKQNFVRVARELRSALDAAGKSDGKTYLVTIAAGADPRHIVDPDGSSAWLASLAGSLDWINIMAYDFHGPWDASSGNVAALYADPADPSPQAATANADAAVRNFLGAGVPARKLVLGMPFYGYGWAGCSAGAAGDGRYQACSGASTGSSGAAFDFAYLTGQGMLTKDASGAYTVGGNGFVRHWNRAAKVPHLYNPSTQVFITYDDEAAVHEKAGYLKSKGLRGGMFWQLDADRNKTLRTVLSNDLPH